MRKRAAGVEHVFIGQVPNENLPKSARKYY